MSDTDLRAAAARLLDDGSNYIYWDGNDTKHKPDDDGQLLARAYLAEHLPDDGEPVTDEWLYSIGFADDRGGTPALGVLHIQPQAINSGRHGEYPAYACIRSVPIPVPKTRGDVRSLLRLLGVEAKEVGDAPV